jgi:hypothetical protein
MGKSRTRKQRSETSQTRKQRLETWKDVVHTKGSNRRSRSKSSTRSINDTWRSASSPSEYKKDEFYTIEQLRYFDTKRDTNNKILYPGNKFEIKLNTDIRNNPLQFTRQYPVTGFLNSFAIDPPLIRIRHKDEYTGKDTYDSYSSKYHLFRVIKVHDYRKTKT